MGTRCTVLIVSDGTREDDAGPTTYTAQLYHHWDGYPDNMLDLIGIAYRAALADAKGSTMGLGARANRAAAFIAAADPAGFDIEPVAMEHGDLQFAYVVRMTAEQYANIPRGLPVWSVEVFDNDPREKRAKQLGTALYAPKGCSIKGAKLGPVKFDADGSTEYGRKSREAAASEER